MKNMNHQTVKIYNSHDFERITKGIKVAQCMRVKSSSLDTEKLVNNLEDLVVSESLCCSFCNTIFEDKAQQRLHYKLDWHRFNLKQRLHGFKSVSEDCFNLLAAKDDVSSISGSEEDSENDNYTDTLEASSFINMYSKGNNSVKIKKMNRKMKSLDVKSESSDDEYVEEDLEENKDNLLLSLASRHTKVFFENEEGHIFSIYRCLLHNKKEIPEIDSEIIAQALESGKKSLWTIIMVGGGHFAAAVFLDGNPLAHKTIHSYSVRSKQGSMQSSRDNRNASSHPKSAGASLRRYNENHLVQQVQEVLESWSSHIFNSSLILYRAVGPYNRAILFGGKNAPLDKNDTRLRPLPFPTRRATFNEVRRVYDILSNMEIYGSAANFTDSFPISPRQPIRKKTPKSVSTDDGMTSNVNNNLMYPSRLVEKQKSLILNKQNKNSRCRIDRAKPRKSPQRPLPDIVAKLAESSSDTELDIQDDTTTIINNINIIEEDFETNFKNDLKSFETAAPRCTRKKHRYQKRKIKEKCVEERYFNEVLAMTKLKLWNACYTGDFELFSTSLNILLEEVNCCNELRNNFLCNKERVQSRSLIGMDDVIYLINNPDDDGNTMLHIAARRNHFSVAWALMDLGSDPCNRNKKLQTPYKVAVNKKIRNMFKAFMEENPRKYRYNK